MTESPGVLFERLLDTMAHLRGPHGCPWDRAQTRASLKPFLIEEAYEVLEAIETGQDRHLREELGDLLLQVVFHARLAEELDEFRMSDVLRGLIDKLMRRHPHVFRDASATTPEAVVVQWEALKQREAEAEGRPRSVIDGVPRSLPSLLRAQRLQSKAARVNFDWPDARAAWEKVEEEMRETAEALAEGDAARVREELGDVLFSLVNVARLSEIDAEDALQGAIEKFRRRFAGMEADLVARGTSVGQAPQDELERSWETAKRQERDTREP
ncbi:MAG: nucleoside triphosphate pyrophosphohydrolase [Candidatus Rokubacteria bacterium RIFCSPLOWO2_02_FULL_73_56]|nr:MAG: nucleoside triphosphate pyrophosphohydrolase [Candidatus Rokubacteria bacterium RIFCSPHIGHO2_02_FULL_73_26]OGL09995.1 MAG: nucleoside triphosphate pyrophosphohydrolase [Candidatus Rokubacteria bacterium RIFCSPLOWO2_02_FULL_73_56]